MNNVAFTIDEKEFKLKILYTKDGNVGFREYGFGQDCIFNSRIDYGKIYAKTLAQFVTETNIYPATAYCVLPDVYAFTDTVETPAVTGSRLQHMLELEISTRYKQGASYNTAFTPINTISGITTTVALMVRGDHVSAAKNALKQFRFPVKYVTTESAMIANAFLNVSPQDRRGTVMFTYILENKTKLCAIRNGKLLGFATLPFGKDLCDLKQGLNTPPPVLVTDDYYRHNYQTVFDCSEDIPAEQNTNYLLRAVIEMRDKFVRNYHIKDMQIKCNVPDTDAPVFAEYKMTDNGGAKNKMIGKYLQLYGALVPKIYDKGLLF